MLCRENGRHAAATFEDAIRRAEATAGEEGGAKAATGGVAGVKRLRHRAEDLAHARRLRAGDAETGDEALPVQIEQLGGRDAGAEDAHRPRNVPAGVVVPGMDREPGPAADLDAERHRGEEIGAAPSVGLGDREGGGDGRRRRVNDGREVSVVEVLEVGEIAVREGGVLEARASRTAPNRGARSASLRLEEREEYLQRGVTRRIERDAEEVDHVPLRLVNDGARQVGVAGPYDVVGDLFRASHVASGRSFDGAGACYESSRLRATALRGGRRRRRRQDVAD